MVTGFTSSSSLYPRAIFDATLAMGYPVALDARAEDLDTLGLTSMMKYWKLFGSRASCTLQPPRISSARMILRDASRSICTSLSVSVCTGATTMESPVWIPTGSTFSMEQTTMAVSLSSLMTSNSISFHPAMDISMRHCPTGERLSPFSTMAFSSALSLAMPPPVPPMVKAGRTMTG